MLQTQRIILVSLLAAVAALVAIYALWRVGASPVSVYTDADAIRVPAADAPLRDILWQPALPMDGPFNSAAHVYEPRFSADGSSLYFVRGKAGENADIFVSSRTPSGWSDPSPLVGLNTPHDELGPQPSPDGTALFFYSNRPDGVGGYDLWMARRTHDGGWSTPENLGPNVNSPSNDYGPAISPDGRVLYFSSNRPQPGDPMPIRAEPWDATLREHLARRHYDLYSSEASDAGFAPARPLALLNTPSNEGAPAVSPFGDFLYFASDRAGGLGGFDLYRARRLRGSYTAAESLGPAINSPANDLDPALNMGGFELVFSSDRAAHDDPANRAYSLFHSTSREVFLEAEAAQATIDWAAWFADILPWLLLLALLLLLLLLLLRMSRSDAMRRRWATLSLLARCLLASIIAHALLLLLLAMWQVSVSIGEHLTPSGPTRVALSGAAAESGILAQVRGNLVDAPTMQPESPSLSAAEFVPEMPDAPASPTITSVDRATPESRPLESPPESPEAMPRAAAAPVPITAHAPDSLAPDPLVMPEAHAPAPRSEASATTDSSEVLTPVARAETSTPAGLVADEASRRTVRVDPSPERHPAPDAALEVFSSSDAAPEPDSAAALSAVRAPGIAAVPSRAATEPSLSTPRELRVDRPSEAEAAADSPIERPQSHRATSIADASPHTEGEPVSIAVKPTSPRESAPASSLVDSTPSSTESAPVAVRVPIAPSSSSTAVADAPAVDPVLTAIPSADARSADATHTTETAINAPDTVGVIADPSRSDAAPSDSGSSAPMTPAQLQPMQSPDRARSSASDTPSLSPAPSVTEAPPTPRGSSAASSPTRSLDVVVPPTTVGSVTVMLPGEPVADAHDPSDESDRESPSRAQAMGLDPPPLDSTQPPPHPSDPSDISALESGPSHPVALDPGRSRAREAPSSPSNPSTGTTPAIADAPTSGPVAASSPAPTASASIATPSSDASPLSLALPTETEPLPDLPVLYPQRAEQLRDAIVEQAGGSRQTEAAVATALRWLADHQAADGRWNGRSFDDGCGQCRGRAQYDFDMALTGLASLCFLGAGHTHLADGPYRDQLARAVQYLLDHQLETGDLRAGESLYSHAIATIALCEAFGMTRDPRLAVPVQNAVDFIAASRSSSGGWRYEPGQPGDTSVLGWQVMALVSAKRCGLNVPDDIFRHASDYLDDAATTNAPGRYAYQPGMPPTFSMTAEALFVRQLLGVGRDDPSSTMSAAHVAGHNAAYNGEESSYAVYYATMALYQHQGPQWEKWNAALAPRLVRTQRTDGKAAGSWDPDDKWARIGGRVYQTAICTLTLEVYYRYLPSYMMPHENADADIPATGAASSP